MKVCVLFFGATAEAVGEREIECSVADTDSASQLVRKIAADHPALGNLKLLFAINEEYVAPEASLNDGDKLAVFSAVSGG
ncbi:MAG TPA: MoaD/ThiS family protein [Pyrinomonadaceae bacterium]|nr:MoaD/ThiS family protein [Pyrinomonadaceae bacterium]